MESILRNPRAQNSLVSTYKKLHPYLQPIRQWLFPSFHKKLVRSVFYLGCAIAADGYFLNGLVQWAMGAVISHYIPDAPQFPSETNDRVLGVWLMGIGLTYSILVFLGEVWERGWVAKIGAEKERNRKKRDFEMYKELRNEFGGASVLGRMISEHDFAGSWAKDQYRAIRDLPAKWNVAEKAFVSTEIQELWVPILNDLEELSRHLVRSASPLKADSNYYGIFDPSLHNDWEWPKIIEDQVEQANEISKRIRSSRDDFLKFSEKFFSDVACEST